MTKLIFTIFFVVTPTMSWLPSEKSVEYDNLILDIVKNNSLTDGKKLLETIKLYTLMVKNTTELLNTDDDNMVDEFTNLYAQGWARFLLHEFDDDNIQKLETKFNWDSSLVTEFKTLLAEAEAAYQQYVVQFHKYLEKEYPTTNSNC